MSLTETWLNEHRNAELSIEGYTIFRSDRDRTRKRGRGRGSGGVATYIRNDIASSFKTILQYSNGVNEILVTYSESEALLIVTIYRQPDDTIHGHPSTHKQFDEILQKLREVFDSIHGKQPVILMCGDFNLPHYNWHDNLLKNGATCDEKNMLHTLFKLTNDYQLLQCISEPTHRAGNTLDF